MCVCVCVCVCEWECSSRSPSSEAAHAGCTPCLQCSLNRTHSQEEICSLVSIHELCCNWLCQRRCHDTTGLKNKTYFSDLLHSWYLQTPCAEGLVLAQCRFLPCVEGDPLCGVWGMGLGARDLLTGSGLCPYLSQRNSLLQK